MISIDKSEILLGVTVFLAYIGRRSEELAKTSKQLEQQMPYRPYRQLHLDIARGYELQGGQLFV